MKPIVKNTFLLLSMLILSAGLWGCSKEDDEAILGEFSPIKWDIVNESPSNIEIKKDAKDHYEVITNGNGGKVTFSCAHEIWDFESVLIRKFSNEGDYLADILTRNITSDENNNDIYELIEWEGIDDKRISKGKILPVDFENEWCKLHIDYPLVTVEFLPYESKGDDSNLMISLIGVVIFYESGSLTLKRK